MKLSQGMRRAGRYGRATLLALLTPLLEKNPSKQRVSRCRAPVILSMARVVVLLFAATMLRQIFRAGVAGWPDATLSIAVVLAIPLLSALEGIKPSQAARLVTSLVGRFGVGAARSIGSVYATEPSKFDDHSSDVADVVAATEVDGAGPARRRRRLEVAA